MYGSMTDMEHDWVIETGDDVLENKKDGEWIFDKYIILF